MKTLISIAAGIFIGSRISNILAYNLAREKEVNLRKQLENYLKENLPKLSATEIQQTITGLLKES